MSRSRRAVLDLLASVADGQPADWDGLETGSDAADPRALRVLRTIAGVAEVHRTLDDAGDPPAAQDRPASRPGRSGWPVAAAGWGSLLLKEKLGSGSSSEVYRAYDGRLDCDVALKLFKTQTEGDPDLVARRLREARMLARVRHDNIVQVFGADEHGGRLGMWMELVEGRTLEQELADRGRWSGREAAAAGQDLCRALAAVHSAGFTHGDIKAHNVVREDGGRLVLMDFGAGRSRFSQERPESGTPLYLAPEVLAGARPGVESDLYSLGVLLYHLVTKTYPITATTVDELKSRHARHEAVPLSNLRPDLDLPFVRVVERALAPKPEDRFRSAGEMEAALAQALGTRRDEPVQWWTRRRQAYAAVAAVVLMLLAVAAVQVLDRPAVLMPDSVAVLPFRTLAGTEHAAQISEGVAADLTSLLGRIPDIQVVSGVSTQQFRETSKPATEIGRALGVKVLVAGTVQMAGDRVSVNVELVDTRTSTQIWSQRYDRSTADFFATQSEIARSIVAELKGRLSPADARRLERPSMQYPAFELYSIGRYHWNKRTPEGFRLSIQYFEKAATADPTAALPYAGLSDAYVLAGAYGVLAPIEAQQRAEAAALKGVELDPELAEAYAALGSIRQEQLRWSEAEAALTRAIELKPGYQPARHWHALYLTSHGRFDDAVSQMRVALAQDPLSVAARGAFGFIHYMKGDLAAAVEHYEVALELEPRSWLHRSLAVARLAQGAPEAALASLDRIQPGSEPEADLNALRASVYALAGRPEQARSLLLRDTAAAATGSAGIEQAAARFLLGEEALGFEWLEAALANRQHDIQYLAVEPRFEKVRGDPRFRALLVKAGLSREP
jgi:TolB-like protein/tRNA A-37 threonylcarbamoyl transferase component Bud32/Flp pilus assembly protein TadD